MAVNRQDAPRLTVLIDELVLDGVAAGDPLITAAIERSVAHALPAGAAIGSGNERPAAIAAASGAAITERVREAV